MPGSYFTKKSANPDPASSSPPAPELPAVISGAPRSNSILENHPHLCGYAFLAAVIVAIFATKLTTFAIAFLFLYLMSDFITNDVRRRAKFLPKALLFSILYLAVIAVFAALFWKVIPDFIRRVPALADNLQAQVISQFDAADKRWGLTDYVNAEEVRAALVDGSRQAITVVARKLTSFYKGFIGFLFALIVNLLLYHNARKVDAIFARRPGSLMAFLYEFTMTRARIFYFFFKRVMTGQLAIAAINAAISSVVIFGLGLPQPVLLLLIVLLFGLFPIVGNLASNTVLTVVAFVTIGLWGAAVCLILLVAVHKLEYFLNSKIIGDIVQLPMVVTLTSLIVCEVLLGIVGLILAIPLVLHIRYELEHIPGLPAQTSDKI